MRGVGVGDGFRASAQLRACLPLCSGTHVRLCTCMCVCLCVCWGWSWGSAG